MPESPEYFDNITIAQYALTGVPLKVYVNGQYYTITAPEDVEDPRFGYGMSTNGEMNPFNYHEVEHLNVSGNIVDIETYKKAMEDESEAVADEKEKEGGDEEESGDAEKEEEGGDEEGGDEEGGGNPFESVMPSLASLVEITKDVKKAREKALDAEEKALKDKRKALDDEPITDGVIDEDELSMISKSRAKASSRQIKKGKRVDEMQIVNKKTGKDITKHVLDYMKKKITKAEFEKLTGLKKDKLKVNESVISDILIIAMESTTYDKFIAELIKQKFLKREDLRDKELADELKAMYRGQALGKRESVNESLEDGYMLNRLADNQLGNEPASEFLSKHNIDLKALAKAKMQGVITAYEIRDIVKGKAPQSTIKKFMKDYVVESVNEELEAPYEYDNISEPYSIKVGDMVKNTNPSCKHFGSQGVVKQIIDMPNDIGQLIKYIVMNQGSTFKPGTVLTKTFDQLEPMK